MACWIGAQSQVNSAKNGKTPPLVTSPTDNHKAKTEFFFSIGTKRLPESVEGLNSSLALAAGEFWPKKYRPLSWPARALKITTKTISLLALDSKA